MCFGGILGLMCGYLEETYDTLRIMVQTAGMYTRWFLMVHVFLASLMCPELSRISTPLIRTRVVVLVMTSPTTTSRARDLGRAIDDTFGDGITSLTFRARDAGDDDDSSVDSSSLALLVTSWDGSTRAYATRDGDALCGGTLTTTASVRRTMIVTFDVPVLCGTFLGSHARACVGCLDGSARVVDLITGATATLGAHAGPTATIAHDETHTGYVVTCGWDKTIRVWHPSASASDGRCVSTTTTAGKCFASDVADGKFLCATSDGQVLAYEMEDLARGGAPTVSRRSSMRFQTRAIAWNATRDGFVAASVEGRCAVEFARDDDDARRRFAFKCHRKTEDATSGETVYPVHALAFHPTLGTFATGGGDGFVNFWDGEARKRLAHVGRFPTSVSALAFSPSGTLLAIASSYAHEEEDGEKPPRDVVYLRWVSDDEVQPKKKSVAVA